MKILIWLIASALCACFYRAGGSGNYPRQTRIVGVPFVSCLALGLMGEFNWWLLLCMALSCGAISTYWGKDGDDKTFINYWLHGFGIALAMLPWTIAVGGHWIGFAVRLVILSLAIAFWSVKVGNAVWEECGRGALIGLTLPLLLI